jgi:hypothetical protein
MLLKEDMVMQYSTSNKKFFLICYLIASLDTYVISFFGKRLCMTSDTVLDSSCLGAMKQYLGIADYAAFVDCIKEHILLDFKKMRMTTTTMIIRTAQRPLTKDLVFDFECFRYNFAIKILSLMP